MGVTKKELARLVRASRSFGYLAIHGDERDAWSFVCPVHRDALREAGERTSGHRFPVHHLPWERTPTVAMVSKALASHLEDAEINEEPCGDLTKAAAR